MSAFFCLGGCSQAVKMTPVYLKPSGTSLTLIDPTRVSSKTGPPYTFLKTILVSEKVVFVKHSIPPGAKQ